MKSLPHKLTPLYLFIYIILSFFSCNNEELFVQEIQIDGEETIIEEEIDENQGIVLFDDNAETSINISTEVDIISNDTIKIVNPVISFEFPVNGDLVYDTNSTPGDIKDDIITYTPNPEFSGEDFFEYTVCSADNMEVCDTAGVTININDGNIKEVSGELKAFPSAYGGGAYATGGRGGNVYHVTNLNDAGEGSLRDALSKPRPAIVVFDVSGTILLESWLTITGKDLTIAGQTAPKGGITITTENFARLKMNNMENVIIRYIRIRPKAGPDSVIDLYGNTGVAKNIIFDHCSISYGKMAFVLRGRESRNVTFQRGLIAESKNGSLFGDSQDHEFSRDNSFLNNLFYNVSHRLPNSGSDGRVDHINNVIQNWRFRMTFVNGDIRLNSVNNYYAMGGRTNLGGGQKNLNCLISSYDNKIYTAGNIIDKGMFTDPKADNKSLWVEFDLGKQNKYAPASEFVDSQYELIGAPLPIRTASEVYHEVITDPDLGANKYLNSNGTFTKYYDANDREYLAVMANGEGAYEDYTTSSNYENRSFFSEARYLNFIASITSVPISTRPKDYDTDLDGMPDEWERKRFGNLLKSGKDDSDNDGYSDLEEFLCLVDM